MTAPVLHTTSGGWRHVKPLGDTLRCPTPRWRRVGPGRMRRRLVCSGRSSICPRRAGLSPSRTSTLLAAHVEFTPIVLPLIAVALTAGESPHTLKRRDFT